MVLDTFQTPQLPAAVADGKAGAKAVAVAVRAARIIIRIMAAEASGIQHISVWRGCRSVDIRRILVAAVLATPLLTSCGHGPASDSGSFRFDTATPPGNVIPVDRRGPAPVARVVLSDGRTMAIGAATGTIQFINFWASWCPPCVAEVHRLEKFVQSAGPGVVVIGVDTKERRDAGATFVAENDLTYPITFDEPGAIALRLGHIPAVGLPFTVVIDKAGRVAGVHLQPLTNDEITRVAADLLAEP